MNFSFSSQLAEWDIPFKETVQTVKESLKSISTPVSSTISKTITIWQDSSSNETNIGILDKLYLYKNYSEVTSFLRKNQFLIPILFEAYGEINLHFKKILKSSLEIVKDYDSGEEKLYLRIATLDPDSYNLLDQLDDTWWIDTMPRARNKMNIDLEY